MSQIGQDKLIAERFKFPFESVESCAWTLTHFFKAELGKRGVDRLASELDAATENHINNVSRWLVEGEKSALLMAGSVGNGKTTMLNAVCRMCNKIYYSNWSVARKAWVWHNALDIVGGYNNELFSVCQHTEWLAIDDLGQEPAEIQNYGTVVYPIRDLLLYRYENNLLTLMTTNLKPSDLRKRYGDRVADRLNEMCQVEFYQEPSYRK